MPRLTSGIDLAGTAAGPTGSDPLRRGDDLVLPFQIDASRLRGRLVRLGPLVDEIVTRHGYPDQVARLLCEAVTLAVILAGALKYEGIFTLQTKGDGPVRLMVTDVTSAGGIRAYAQFDGEKLPPALPADSHAAPSVPRLIGAGYIAFTVDQGEHTDRYQGIVELQGATLADCAHHYFRQSEQIETGIKLAAGRDGAGKWRAGGLMLQRLPAEEDGRMGRSEADDDAWRHAMVLMSSSTSAEMLDPALPPTDLLYRLFHEDGVRVFRTHPLSAKCRCSTDRVTLILGGLTPDEIADLKVDGAISVVCEFCGTKYLFDDAALADLRRGNPATGAGPA